MAEPFEIKKQPTSFMDVLRTLALVGGAGLSADPRGRPLGAALTAGGLLIGQGQERNRKNALSSALAAISRGDSDLPSVQSALAERGYYTPDIEKDLRKADIDRRIAPIQEATLNRLTQLGTGASDATGQQEIRPLLAQGSSPSGASILGAGVGGGPIGAGLGRDKANASSFLRPPSPPDVAENIEQLTRTPGGIAQLAIVNPAAANAMLTQRRLDQSMAQHNESAARSAAQHAITEERLQRKAQLEQQKFDKRLAEQTATGEYLTTALDPNTSREQLREATVNAARQGVESGVFNRYGDPASDINLNVRTYLSKMGLNAHTANAGDVEAANRAYLRDQTKQQADIKTALIKAQTSAAWDVPLKPADAKAYVNPKTLERAPVGLTPRQARDGGFIAMDPISQRAVRGVNKAEGLLGRLEILALGGPVNAEDAKVLGIKPGTVLPPIFEGKEGSGIVESLLGRMKATGHLRLDMLEQNMRGIRANLYERLKKSYLAVFSRGPGEERGATTQFDVDRAEKGFAIAAPDSLLGLSDTLEQSKALFNYQRDILKDIRERAFGLNGLEDVNKMTPPPPPSVPGVSPSISSPEGGGAAASPAAPPAPVPQADISNALNSLQQLLQPGQ